MFKASQGRAGDPPPFLKKAFAETLPPNIMASGTGDLRGRLGFIDNEGGDPMGSAAVYEEKEKGWGHGSAGGGFAWTLQSLVLSPKHCIKKQTASTTLGERWGRRV